MVRRIRIRGSMRRTARLLSAVAVSGALVTAFSMSTAQAAAHLASTKVTLVRSHSPVITGNAVDFSGQVTPHSQRTITLEQKVRGKWKALASAKSNHSGAYKFRWVISAPGSLAFRVGVKATKTAKGANSSSVTVIGERWHYLSDVPDVSSSCDCGDGPVEVNGKTYAHSVYETDTFGTSTIDYNLKRSCVAFTVVAGLGDNSNSDASEEMDVLLDGTNKFSRDFSLGQSANVNIKVTGNLRLRLSWTQVSGSGADVGWGNARILCKW